MTEYGGQIVRTVPLTWEENAWCLGIASVTLLIGVLIKFVPARWFSKMAMKETEMDDEQVEGTITATLRRSFRQSTLRRLQEEESKKGE